MDEWDVMFREVRETVRLANSWEDGVQWAAALALRRPDIFDDPAYWARVKERDFGYSFGIVTQWAIEGLKKVDAKTGWERSCLILETARKPLIWRFMALLSKNVSLQKQTT